MPAKKSAAKKVTRAKTIVLPAWMTEVTPFSKALAMTMFVLLPFFSFWFGMKFQHSMLKDLFQSSQVVIRKGCSAPEQWMQDDENLEKSENDRMGRSASPMPSPQPRS